VKIANNKLKNEKYEIINIENNDYQNDIIEIIFFVLKIDIKNIDFLAHNEN